MSVTRRLVAIAVLALVALAAVVATLGDVAGREVGQKVGRGRSTYLLGVLRTAAETNLSFGVPLEQISTMQALIEREKISNPQILAIDIFYPEGRAVFSTDRGALGEPVPASWVEALQHHSPWRLDEHGEIIFGTSIENDIGETGGGIAITTSDAERANREAALRLDLIGLTLVVAGAGALFAALLMGVLAHTVERPFARALRTLTGTMSHAAPRSRLGALAFEARQRWREAHRAAERANDHLRAIDDA
ncbi:hypothetical protein MWN34_10465 [Ancylobacter sp. 6x-1]|uniref:HAMP domain-containing protein n=1 Tax=Ancylobacter crimeensis TaxID=2579147 RepID=A0ABT0DBK0_9HYPH|nr:hypothetical protein [Ancylobacter crimeensis]MCK0197335.1 hypothetical protein [Ancylobacter crimeensis]